MQPLDEDWKLLLNLLPAGWEQQAILSGASERLRGFATISDLLRTLLLHVGKGYSLRETAVRAGGAGHCGGIRRGVAQTFGAGRGVVAASMRPVAVAGEWLGDAGGGVLAERACVFWTGPWSRNRAGKVRSGDPDYGVRIPSLVCDHLELTAVKGAGAGESLERFAASPGDLVLVTVVFGKPGGVEALHRQGAAVMVRLNSSTLPLWDQAGARFGLLAQVTQVKETGAEREWPVWVQGPKSASLGGCVIPAKGKA